MQMPVHTFSLWSQTNAALAGAPGRYLENEVKCSDSVTQRYVLGYLLPPLDSEDGCRGRKGLLSPWRGTAPAGAARALVSYLQISLKTLPRVSPLRQPGGSGPLENERKRIVCFVPGDHGESQEWVRSRARRWESTQDRLTAAPTPASCQWCDTGRQPAYLLPVHLKCVGSPFLRKYFPDENLYTGRASRL